MGGGLIASLAAWQLKKLLHNYALRCSQFIVPASLSLQDEPYIIKMWILFISGKVALWRYITVWLIAVSSNFFTLASTESP